MKLTIPQRKLLQEQEQPQEDGRVSKVVAKITAWLNQQAKNHLGTYLLELANQGNDQLVNWLKTQNGQHKQELAAVVADMAVKAAYEQITGEAADMSDGFADYFSTAGLISKGVGWLASGFFKKVKAHLEQSQAHQNLVQMVTKYIDSYLTLGNIPDELAAKSELLQSYDIPDKLQQVLGNRGAHRVMKILTILGTRQDLLDTMKTIVNQYR